MTITVKAISETLDTSVHYPGEIDKKKLPEILNINRFMYMYTKHVFRIECLCVVLTGGVTPQSLRHFNILKKFNRTKDEKYFVAYFLYPYVLQ